MDHRGKSPDVPQVPAGRGLWEFDKRVFGIQQEYNLPGPIVRIAAGEPWRGYVLICVE